MSYLIPNDYLRGIQDVVLNQVISQNPVYRTIVAQQAQEDFKEFLSQRFDLTQEFTDTNQYDPTQAYNAGNRIYLNAPAYSATSTYALGVLTTAPTGPVVNGIPTGQVYACFVAITVPEVFTPAHWTLLGNQWDIFYALYPYPVFDLTHDFYNIGDIVWWKNHTYTALQASVCLSHAEALQYYTTNNIPAQNVFPDQMTNGPLFWKDNGAYVIPAGNLLTQNPATYFLISQVRDNIYLRGGTQLPVGGNAYTDTTWAGWDFFIEKTGYGTLIPGQDFNYAFPAGPPAATNPGLLATGFILLNGATFLNLAQYTIHFQAIISQTAPLNPFSSMTSQQIITTYFIKGDNRNQKVLQHYIALVLFYLYQRVAPKNIPDTRMDGKKEAMAWLTMCMKGNIVPDLVQIQPPQGRRIRTGSNIKQCNAY